MYVTGVQSRMLKAVEKMVDLPLLIRIWKITTHYSWNYNYLKSSDDLLDPRGILERYAKKFVQPDEYRTKRK